MYFSMEVAAFAEVNSYLILAEESTEKVLFIIIRIVSSSFLKCLGSERVPYFYSENRLK